MHGYGSNEEDLFSFSENYLRNIMWFRTSTFYDLQYGSYAVSLLTLMRIKINW
jgi:hypothetical protein